MLDEKLSSVPGLAPASLRWRRGPEPKMMLVHQMEQSPFLAGVLAPRA